LLAKKAQLRILEDHKHLVQVVGLKEINAQSVQDVSSKGKGINRSKLKDAISNSNYLMCDNSIFAGAEADQAGLGPADRGANIRQLELLPVACRLPDHLAQTVGLRKQLIFNC
jgi:hypothetical protein